jgi:HPt (histidine-containing phosphotransfer) domain-containing protein
MDEDQLNLSALASGLRVEESQVRDLFDLFLETAWADLARLESAVVKNDPEQAVDAAHSIKGAALSFGLARLSKQAFKVEQIARHGSMTGVDSLVQDLQSRLHRVASLVSR